MTQAIKAAALTHAQYVEGVKRHLSEYKQHHLGVTEDGRWVKNGQLYPHILPSSQKKLNIIEQYRDAFWRDFDAGLLGKAIALHADFHHLNSSQALAFNLFYPFVMDGGRHLTKLLPLLELRSEGDKSPEFEAVLNQEEFTNFDFCVHYLDGIHATVEVKFTENGFGSAKQDKRHRDKWDRVYKPLAVKCLNPEWAEEAKFLENYQLLRNLVYLGLNEGNTALFLFPENNPAFAGIERSIDDALPQRHRARARTYGLGRLTESLLQLAKQIGEPKMVGHFEEFRRKYLLVDAVVA